MAARSYASWLGERHGRMLGKAWWAIVQCCPWVSRAKYNRLWAERNTLADALRNANDELRRHRRLISAIQDGHGDTIAALDRVLEKRRTGAA